MYALGLATIPVFIWIFYIYIRDKYEKEPIHFILATFLMGAAIIIPVGFVAFVRDSLVFSDVVKVDNIAGAFRKMSLTEILIYSVIGVGLVEEGFKYLVLKALVWKNKNFNEKFDGIVYGVAASLGFAIIENISYILPSPVWISVGIMRAFTAIPAHAAFGIFMGYYLGLARFEENKSKKEILLIKSLFIPAVIHGLYDFFLFATTKYQSYILASVVFFIIVFFSSMKLISSVSCQTNKKTIELDYLYSSAGFLRRMAAFIIDSIIILSILASSVQVIINYYNEHGVLDENNIILGATIILYFGIINWLYYTILESSEIKATVGKWILNIVVTDENKQRISLLKANIRYFSKIFFSLFFMVGYIFMFFNDSYQTIHDKISSSFVFRRKLCSDEIHDNSDVEMSSSVDID